MKKIARMGAVALAAVAMALALATAVTGAETAITPLFPALRSGPAQRLFQGLSSKSKFLAALHPRSVEYARRAEGKFLSVRLLP
jgi:hypothetical protein